MYPHKLRHTCATQLLNAGCPVTSIQKFLGHKKLNTTMVYARAHDHTVEADYFAAMKAMAASQGKSLSEFVRETLESALQLDVQAKRLAAFYARTMEDMS